MSGLNWFRFSHHPTDVMIEADNVVRDAHGCLFPVSAGKVNELRALFEKVVSTGASPEDVLNLMEISRGFGQQSGYERGKQDSWSSF